MGLLRWLGWLRLLRWLRWEGELGAGFVKLDDYAAEYDS
jgi:hypothetical protein